MKPAVISVHRPRTLAPRKLLVRMHFPDLQEDVRRARVETRVLEPRVAGEVASATPYQTRVEQLLAEVLWLGGMKEWYDASQVCRNEYKFP